MLCECLAKAALPPAVRTERPSLGAGGVPSRVAHRRGAHGWRDRMTRRHDSAGGLNRSKGFRQLRHRYVARHKVGPNILGVSHRGNYFPGRCGYPASCLTEPFDLRNAGRAGVNVPQAGVL